MRKITKEMGNKLIELYKAGNSVKSIAKKYRVTYYSVYTYLGKAGVLRSQTVITQKMINEWIELYKSGKVNCVWLAKKYKVSRNTISRTLKAYGIKTSKKVPKIIEEDEY